MSRRDYAEEVLAAAGVKDDPRLLEAFAKVSREDFLGPGPWEVVVFEGTKPAYQRTPDADPARVNRNVVVAIDSARNLNNGHPSALATWIHLLEVKPSDSVLHIGAGVGYYTAILAELAREVAGIEVDPKLAARARAMRLNVFEGDGSDTHGMHDVIFVNAGATHVREEWLAALKPGGRLLVPITVPIPQSPIQVANTNPGAMLLVHADGAARFTGPVQIFDCAGARDSSLEPALREALLGGRAREVRRLRRDPHEPQRTCVVHAAGRCLSG